MELNVLEQDKNKLKVEVIGETHTLINIMREKAWKAGATQATYMVEHPQMSQPKIIIRAANPKKVLVDSAQLVLDDLKEFQQEFKRAKK